MSLSSIHTVCLTPGSDFAPEGDAIFVVKLQDYTATEKDEVTLDCELSKDVPVVWYHNEKEIIASKLIVMRSEGTRRSLVLKKVEQNDKGKYVCDCGTDKTSANINIEGKHDGRISCIALKLMTKKHLFKEMKTFSISGRIFCPFLKFIHLQPHKHVTLRLFGRFMGWSCLTERRLVSRWRSLRTMSTASGS